MYRLPHVSAPPHINGDPKLMLSLGEAINAEISGNNPSATLLGFGPRDGDHWLRAANVTKY